MSTRRLRLTGNDAHRAAFTSMAVQRKQRERELVLGVSPALYGTTPHRRAPMTIRGEPGRRASALVLTETGVLGSGDRFPSCSTVGLILSAKRLSRSWEEGPWHAS